MFTTTPRLPICARCLFRRPLPHRSLSTANPPTHPPPTGFARLPSRRLLSLHGPDAAHFLQGLTTSNTRAAAAGGGWYSAFLNAQGRVLHDVFIYAAGQARAYREYVGGGKEVGEQGFLIEVDAREVERLAGWMERFRLRARVAVRVCEVGEWAVWSVWDEGGEEGVPEGGIGCVDERAPGMGRRVVVLGGGGLEGVLGERYVEVGEGAYTVRRMLRGVPEGQGEIARGVALPGESCVDFMGGVDWRKGCYVGQELTIRTHHTGVVRKRILPVRLYTAEEGIPGELEYVADWEGGGRPASGTDIVRVKVGGGRKRAGRWVAGVGNVGLALCRLEIMTDVVLIGEGGGGGSPQREFGMAWGSEGGGEAGEIRVKAFVPEWYRNRVGVRNVQRERNV